MICICCPPNADDAAGARAGAGQRAISIRQNAQDLPRPEWKITSFVFLEMFLASATSSVATVGVVWATVVLLGGFVSKLNILDFWLIIAVTLIQSMRIFGGDWNPDQKILYGLSDRNILKTLFRQGPFAAVNFKICYILVWMMEAMMLFITPNMTFILLCGKLVFFSGAFVVALLKNTVLLVTMVMSVTRLVYPAFGDAGQSTEDINKKASIIIFYGVAIAQALMSYLVFAYSQARPELLSTVYEDYKFGDKDEEPLRLYYVHVRKICRDGHISAALELNLAAFAVQCLKSNERDVNRSGIRLLNNLTQAGAAEDFKTAITKLGDCHDAVESLFRLAASTSPEERRERKMAALLIEKLPDSFHISGFLFAMRSVCSLLEATTTDKDSGSGVVEVDKVLVQIGLDILEKFSRHVCNLPDISDSHELMAKITRFTSQIENSQASDPSHIDFMKAKGSLSVLGKLAGATGKRGRILWQDILQNVLLLSSVREMLQNPSINIGLRELAIPVIDGFSLDPETRNCGATRKMAIVLLSIFCSPHEVNDEVQIKFQLSAGRTVARLTTESTSNCDAIITAENLEALRSMISSQPTTAQGVVAANVLRNLCEFLTPGTQDTMRQFAQENMMAVLTRICETDNLVGEAMEAFLSLALQLLGRATDPGAEFREALNANGIGCESFVQKLNSVLDEANARAADRNPGIRRSAIELAIWMIRSEDQLKCTQHLVNCGMRDALMAVKATREENFKLLSADDVPVLEHEETLSALVKTALRLIPVQPNGP